MQVDGSIKTINQGANGPCRKKPSLSSPHLPGLAHTVRPRDSLWPVSFSGPHGRVTHRLQGSSVPCAALHAGLFFS